MIPSFKPGILSSNRIRAAGGGADVTPNAINWTNIQSNKDSDTWSSTEQQLTGINTSITLKITPSSGTNFLYYRAAATSAQSGFGYNWPGDIPYYDIQTRADNGDGVLINPLTTSGVSFSVSNNNYICFIAGNQNSADSITMTVINQSDSNTTLDTFEVVTVDLL